MAKKNFIDYTFSPTRNVNTTDASGYETFKGDSQYDQGLVHNTNQDLLRATNQPWTHEFGNAVGQIVLNTVPTIVGNVASMLDFEDYFNQDNEVGNAITRATEEWKQSISQDTLPIYQQEPNKALNLGSSEWWMKAFADTGTSALAFAGTGLLTGAGIGSLGRVLSMSNTLSKYGQAGKVAAQTLTAVGLNQAESIPIAMNVYDDIYSQAQEQVQAGLMTDEEAKQKASDAAAYSINLNRANVLLNLTSSGMFIKNPAMTRKLVDQVALKNTYKSLGYEGLQEAGEELMNLGAEATAKEFGKASLQGQEYTNATQDFINAIMTKEGLESAFLGALGGMAQQGASIASKHIQGDYKAQQELFGKQQAYLADLNVAQASNGGMTSNRFTDALSRTGEYNKQYQEAIDKNDLNGAEFVANKALNDQAFEAYSLGTTDKLEDLYKRIGELKPEEALQKGLDTNPDSPFFYQKRSKEALKTIKENEGLYSSIANQYGYNENLSRSIFENRTQQQYNLNKLKDLDSKLSTVRTKAYDDASALGLDLDKDIQEVKNIPSYEEMTRIQKEIKGVQESIKEATDSYKELTSPESIKLAKQQAKEKQKALKPKKAPKVETSVAKTESPVQEEQTIQDDISQKEYEDFQNNRVVSDRIIEDITSKLVNGATVQDLSPREAEILNATPEIKQRAEELGIVFPKAPTETSVNKSEPSSETKEKIVEGDQEVSPSWVKIKMNPRPLDFKDTKKEGGKITSPTGIHAKAYPEFKKGRVILLKPNKTPKIKVEVNTLEFKENKEYTPDTLPLVVSIQGEDGKYHRFSNIASDPTKVIYQEKELREQVWNALVENPTDKNLREVKLKKSDFNITLNRNFHVLRSENKDYTVAQLFNKNPEHVYQKDKNVATPTITVISNGQGVAYTGSYKENVGFNIPDGIYIGLINPAGVVKPEALQYEGDLNKLISKLEAGEDVSKSLKTTVFPDQPFQVTSFFVDNGFDNPARVNGKLIMEDDNYAAKVGTGQEVRPIDVASEVEWIKSHLGESVPVEVVEDIQTLSSHGGETIWGVFKDGMIYLTEKAGEGTGYHEAFHAVFRLMLNDSKIDSILSEARSKYPKLKNATDLEVEEFLADKFAEYIINNQETRVKGTGIKAFFERLWNWAKNLINRSDIDTLFQNIENRKYYSPGIKRSLNRFTSNKSEFSYPVYKKLVPGLSLDQEKRRMNNIHYLFNQSIIEGNQDNVDSINALYNEMDSKQKQEMYRKAFDKIQTIAKNLPEASKSQVEALTDHFEMFQFEHESWMQSLNDGVVNPEIRQYLSELYEHAQDGTEAADELGLPIYEDFDKNFKLIHGAINGAKDINQAIEILNALKDQHPQLQKVVKDLISDNSRLNKEAFMTTFTGKEGIKQMESYKPQVVEDTPFKEHRELKAEAKVGIEATEGAMEKGEISTLTTALKKYKESLNNRINKIAQATGDNALKQEKLKSLKGLRNSLIKANEEEQFARILYFTSKDLDNLIKEFDSHKGNLGSEEYAQFVHQTKKYLDSLSILSTPTEVYEKEDLQYIVNNINLKINKLGNLVTKGTEDQIKTLVKQFSSNPELVNTDAIKKLIEGTIDISTFQFQFGALASSEDPLLALADKRLKMQKRKTYDFTLGLREELVRHRDNLFKETGKHTQEWMQQTDASGNHTGGVVQRVAYSYYQKVRQFTDPLYNGEGKKLEYIEDPKTTEDLNHNVNLARAYKALEDFFNPEVNDDHEYTQEFLEAREHFETRLDNGTWAVKPEFIAVEYVDEDGNSEYEYTKEYLNYRDTYYTYLGEQLKPVTHEEGAFTGEVEKKPTYIVKGIYKEVSDKWNDKAWEEIQNSPAKKEFYDFYMKTMEESIGKLPTGAFDIHTLPACYKTLTDVLVDSPNKLQVFGSMIQNFTKFDTTSKKGYYDSSTGMMEQQLPVYYTSKLQDEALVAELKEKLKDLDPEADKQQIEAISRRLKIAEERKKVSDVSSDMFNVLEQFATMAENYKNLQEIEGTLMIVKDVINNRKIYETDSKGNLVYEDDAKTIPMVKSGSGQLSKAARRYKDWIESVFYEEPLDEGVMGEIADKFMKYTSLRGLGLNFFSGVNNLVMGGIQQNIEAVGGQFYSKEQYLQATKELSSFMFNDLFKHLGSEKAAFTGVHTSKMMAFIEKFDILQDHSEMTGRGDKGAKRFLKRALGMNWAFVALEAGEFFNQSRLGISVALNTPITSSTGEESNLWEALELVDGKLQFKEGFSMDANTIAEVSNKMRGVNQYIHGRYTKEDASRIQRFWTGRLCMQFRKWMAPAIEQRFRSRYYDERIGTYLEGRYNTAYALLNELQKQSWNMKKVWNNLDDVQKANMKKNAMEFGYLLMAFAGAQLLASILENVDDDDEILQKTVNFMKYQEDRLVTELSQFANPLAAWDMVKSPIAGATMLKEGSQFLLETLNLPVSLVTGEELHYASGVNEGRLRIAKEGLDLLPFGTQLNKWLNLEDSNSTYYIK